MEIGFSLRIHRAFSVPPKPCLSEGVDDVPVPVWFSRTPSGILLRTSVRVCVSSFFRMQQRPFRNWTPNGWINRSPGVRVLCECAKNQRASYRIHNCLCRIAYWTACPSCTGEWVNGIRDKCLTWAINLKHKALSREGEWCTGGSVVTVQALEKSI